MSNVIKEKVIAAQKLFDREVIVNKKGDTDKGNNYSKILGPKVLKQIDSILKMFKDFDGAFVGIDLKDNSAVFIGNSAASIDDPDTIGIKLDYIFKDVKPDLIISMYKEAGIKKLFEKAINDVTQAGFITTKEKNIILNSDKSIINMRKNNIEEALDDKVTISTYHKVLLEPIILTFFSYYLYYFFELRNPEFMDTPKVTLGKSSIYVIYPFNLTNNVKFNINVKVPFTVTNDPEALEGKSFKGWGYDLLPPIKKVVEKEEKKKEKELETKKDKEEKEHIKNLELFESGEITPKHKKMFLLFNDIKENFGEDFLEMAIKQFPVEFKMSQMYELGDFEKGISNKDLKQKLERDPHTYDPDLSEDKLSKIAEKFHKKEEDRREKKRKK